jgi:hypothetical protein
MVWSGSDLPMSLAEGMRFRVLPGRIVVAVSFGIQEFLFVVISGIFHQKRTSLCSVHY